MIDFIKYKILDRELFLNNVENAPELDFKGRFHYLTGEVLDFPMIAEHKKNIIKITENVAAVSGSIHKYYNILEGYGEHNYNDFSYCDYNYAISNLLGKLKTNKSDTKITNLEFGLNIEIDKNPKDIIDNHILMYNFIPPNRDEKFEGKGDFLEFQMTDYNLKIYNKSKHYNLDKNILRVELKIKRSRYLEKHFGISTLKDLDRKRFNLLFKKLLEHYDKLLIVDGLSLNEDSRLDENVLFSNGINPNYWRNFKSNNTVKSQNKFNNEFQKLLKSKGMLKSKAMIKKLLKEKYRELMNCDCNFISNVA